VIDDFGHNDVIEIDDFLATAPPTYAGDFLSLQGTDASGQDPETVTLDIPGRALSDFQITTGGTDTLIETAACYCGGTLIRTARGQKRVEELKIGDSVVTASGAARPIKWIGRRSYAGRFIASRKDILPICIKACALDENVPRRDLWISPHHAMYLDGMLIEAKDLVNGVSIVQSEGVDKVDYFHIELETHDLIVAEGALSETFVDDDSRGIFHNADEYLSLYAETAPQLARYCAPRADCGHEVEQVRRAIAVRAGVSVSGGTGGLRGYVDTVTSNCIAGWAQNVDHPDAPVCLDIYAGTRLLGQVLANRYRADLKRAGLGSGCHGFKFKPRRSLAFAPYVIEVRRSLDGAELRRSTPSNIVVHRRVARGG
jgi:hypothetical protein